MHNPDNHPSPMPHAMVLAAGKGTRMRPFTETIPKPMVKIAGTTLIDGVLQKLMEAGVTRIVVNTHYMAPLLEAHLANSFASSHAKLIISREEELLETGGGVANALPFLSSTSPFFVVNSDILWVDAKGSSAFTQLLSLWDDHKMDALLLLFPTNTALGYEGKGDFYWDAASLTLSRPLTSDVPLPYVFTGIQLLSPRLFQEIPSGPFPLTSLYRKHLQEDGLFTRIYGACLDGQWLHVGTPEGVSLAEDYLQSIQN